MRCDVNVSVPVSYTHLDVYKRQLCFRQIDHRQSLFSGITDGVGGAARFGGEITQADSAAVHQPPIALKQADVYKRQVYTSAFQKSTFCSDL